VRPSPGATRQALPVAPAVTVKRDLVAGHLQPSIRLLLRAIRVALLIAARCWTLPGDECRVSADEGPLEQVSKDLSLLTSSDMFWNKLCIADYGTFGTPGTFPIVQHLFCDCSGAMPSFCLPTATPIRSCP